MLFKICSFLSHSPESHCQQLIEPILTNLFPTFFLYILSHPCHLWFHASDLNPSFYQANQASAKGPAVPVARQGQRTGCSSWSILTPGIFSPPSLLSSPMSLVPSHSSNQ